MSARAGVAAVVLAGAALGGCSSAGRDPAAVRIGGVSIGESTVDHWARAIKRGDPVGAAVGTSSGTPRQQALTFLISAHWLIGEAVEEGLPVSGAAVDRGLKQRVESTAGGDSEFKEELASTGLTADDVKLEIKAELAARALHELIVSRMPNVAPVRTVIDYYRRHIASYRVPERRTVDLIESISSRAKALELGRRLGSGKRFSDKALREVVEPETPEQAARNGNAELIHAIFAAAPGRVAAPARFNGRWVLLVVRGRTPGRTKSLKEVEVEIDHYLLGVENHLLFVDFLKEYRELWAPRTDCSPGFVVQKCSQYRGRLRPEEDPISSV